MTLVQGTTPLEAVETFPALAELYRAHAPRLRGLARLLVADASVADELVQDAFIGLQRNAGRLRDLDAAPAYLRTSVVNSARSWYRRRDQNPDASQLDPTPGPTPDDAAVSADECRRIALAVRTLPDKQRACVVLRYYHDLAYTEIAELLGIPVGSVKSRLHRGLAALEPSLRGLR